MELLSPNNFKQYSLIDCGDGEKLERFNTTIVRRPEPQAIWKKKLPESQWNKADFYFQPKGSHSGNWIKNSRKDENWLIEHRYKQHKISLNLALTSFKHVGVFPEQAVNWDYIIENITKIGGTPKVLNLFAYTGGASLAARSAGADVVHVDSIKQVVSWSKRNMESSGLEDIRWTVEDAHKFVKREAKRGNLYEGIIMDPPAYGHGPKGEKWKLEEKIYELLEDVSKILNPKKHFFIINTYSLGFSHLIIENLLKQTLGVNNFQSGELFIESEQKDKLPLGVFCRFAKTT